MKIRKCWRRLKKLWFLHHCRYPLLTGGQISVRNDIELGKKMDEKLPLCRAEVCPGTADSTWETSSHEARPKA